MVQSHGNDNITYRDRKSLIIWLLVYFKPYLPLLTLSIVFAILINVSVIVKPYIIKYIIDDYLAVGINAPDVFLYTGLLYFGVVLIGVGLSYSQTYILTYIGQKIMYDIRNQLFTHIQNMSTKFFDKNSSGRILTRVTNDVESLNDIFSGVLVNSIKDIIMIVGIVITMFSINSELALISICSIPLIAVITLIYRKAARKNFIKMKALIGRINGFLAENISGVKLVRIFHREKEKFEEFQKLDKEYFDTSLRELILHSLCRPIIEVINTLTIALLIWYSAGTVVGGYLEIGVLYAFINYVKEFFAPINEIADIYTSIQSALVSAERIFDILNNHEMLEDTEQGVPVDRIKGEIEFKNVWFYYNEGEWVLKDVSFKIEPGQTVAFVGHTGSGKSTIINLMARFYDIQKGEILVDGINIKEYNLKDLRRQIAVVMQDVFLFSGDINLNIRLRNESITDDDIVRAAKLVCADKFIESLPNRYNQEVKERGCTFSAGQRQLISFARAVAFNPAVVVLDEATANIDTETEIAIQRAMANISKNSTTIIIAHRLSTIRNADKIFVIDDGRIKETGTHDQLMEKGGIYRQLYERQLNYQWIA
ncbi:MAG: ABC transporter ATP-binding protein [Clostridiales bacterium]|nr:ABC transporter ATP-binding protein [Clostridiales bacterium]